MRVLASEDRFEVVGGLKLFEQSMSQKVLSVPAIQRACHFAFDTIQLGAQLQKSLRVPFCFQVAIHCPPSVATGVIGIVRSNIILVGNQFHKTEFILNRT